MKLIKLMVFALLVMGYSCTPPSSEFIGYVVAKKHSPERMSNEADETYIYSRVFFHPVVHHRSPPPKPHRVAESFSLFVANRFETKEVFVSQDTWNKTKLGQKVKFILK